MCFTAFEHADSCLQSVQHSCQKVWQEPTVDSIDGAKAFLKEMCLFFFCLQQVQHQLLQYFPKSTAVLWKSCFVLNRVLCDLQKVFRMCNIFVHEVECGLKQRKANFLL